MATILDCSSCGAPLPADRRCCPHCHCKNAAWKRWAVVASTALGLAGCGDDALNNDDHSDMHKKAAADMAHFQGGADYGPAEIFEEDLAAHASHDVNEGEK